MELTLEKTIKVIKKYSGTSRFKFWNTMNNGDIIHIKTIVGDSSKFYLYNHTSGISKIEYMNGLARYMGKVSWKETPKVVEETTRISSEDGAILKEMNVPMSDDRPIDQLYTGYKFK